MCPPRTRVLAAAKRGGGAGGGGGKRRGKRAKELDEVAQFEQLMCDWDDAFAADCLDTNKAAVVARLSQEGYRQHGRGFVFVRSQLERRTRRASAEGGGAPKGFGAAAQPTDRGTPLATNPQLHLLAWTACYIPGSRLDELGSPLTLQEGALLPDSRSLLAAGGADAADADGRAAAEAWEELRRVLRGQDLSQLRTYLGAAWDPAPTSSSSEQDGTPAELEAAQSTMQGIRRYEPDSDEVVVLLAAKIDGKPSVGAELLVVARDGDGGTALELPDGWEQALAAA